jgi:uncharacterized protein (TIGR03118 family)
VRRFNPAQTLEVRAERALPISPLVPCFEEASMFVKRDPQVARRNHSIRPTLENLEDRLVLSFASLTPGNNFLQVNVVANVAGVATATDPNLVHPDGISEGAGGPFWVSESGTNVSTLYNVTPTSTGSNIVNKLVVAIPGPNGSAANVTTSPTGQVNPSHDGTTFVIPGTGPGLGVDAAFVFATADGTIAAWDFALSPNTRAVTVADDSASGADFTGLASATINKQSFLYAADFRNGTIDVFDTNFKPVSPSSPSSPLDPNAFKDAEIPKGFSPYNIQQLNGNLFVTYARVGADGTPVVGKGQGFVAEFSPTGKLMTTFQGHLDAPYGVAIAPSTFGRFGGDLLVANTGSGRISAFNTTNGRFDGFLNNAAGTPLTINGLRALQFGNGNGGGVAGVLYFTADPTQGAAKGLFGSLSFVSETAGAQADTAILQTVLADNPMTQSTLLSQLAAAQKALASDATLTQAQSDLQTALNNVLTANTPIINQPVLTHVPIQVLDVVFELLIDLSKI